MEKNSILGTARETFQRRLSLEYNLTLMENISSTGEEALPSDLGAEDAGDLDSVSVMVTVSERLTLPRPVCPEKFCKKCC